MRTLIVALFTAACIQAAKPPVVKVEGQPLASNARRLIQAFDFLGEPLTIPGLNKAIAKQDAKQLQQLLDQRVWFTVSINPEYRVKTATTSPRFNLQQNGYRAALVKVINESDTTPRLAMTSPQSGAVYAGASKFTMLRMQSTELTENQNNDQRSDRFLDLEVHAAPPMSDQLNGLAVEYKIALLYASESGKREAVIGFNCKRRPKSAAGRRAK